MSFAVTCFVVCALALEPVVRVSGQTGCRRLFKDVMKVAFTYSSNESFYQAFNFYNATMGLTVSVAPTSITTSAGGVTTTYTQASVRIPGSNTTAIEFLYLPVNYAERNYTSWVELEASCFTGALDYFTDRGITAPLRTFPGLYFDLLVARITEPGLSNGRALQTNWYRPWYFQDRYVYGYNPVTFEPEPIPDNFNLLNILDITAYTIRTGPGNYANDKSAMTAVLCKPTATNGTTLTWTFSSGPRLVLESTTSNAQAQRFVLEASVSNLSVVKQKLQAAGVNVGDLSRPVTLYGIPWQFVQS